MSASDILISIAIALAVNLATPLIRRSLVSSATNINAKLESASVKVLKKRKSQLEESLRWYKEKSEPSKILEWLLPHVFIQIIFLWFIVLLPYILNLTSGFWDIPVAVSKGGMYGLAGLGTRYFFSFIIIATMAQKSLSFQETEKTINKQLHEINQKLDNNNG
jgi:hypothetical protein